MNAVDKNGSPLLPGDIVTVEVKYQIDKINPDGSVLAHKVYDVPSQALTLFDKAIK